LLRAFAGGAFTLQQPEGRRRNLDPVVFFEKRLESKDFTCRHARVEDARKLTAQRCLAIARSSTGLR
jgi:hypothetical protein